jgi:hypothetical protein
MSTTTLNNKFNEISKITEDFALSGSLNKASTIVKIVSLTTNEESHKNSLKLVKALEELKQSIIYTTTSFDKELAKETHNFVNEAVVNIKNFLEGISSVFDEAQEIEMDDQKVYDMLANMQKAEKILSYISDYLSLLMQVQNEKAVPKNKSSFVDLITLLKASA